MGCVMGREIQGGRGEPLLSAPVGTSRRPRGALFKRHGLVYCLRLHAHPATDLTRQLGFAVLDRPFLHDLSAEGDGFGAGKIIVSEPRGDKRTPPFAAAYSKVSSCARYMRNQNLRRHCGCRMVRMLCTAHLLGHASL